MPLTWSKRQNSVTTSSVNNFISQWQVEVLSFMAGFHAFIFLLFFIINEDEQYIL